MHGIQVAVHQRHRHAAQTARISGLQGRARGFFVQRRHLGPVGIQTARHLGHGLVQQIGAADVQVEQGWPGLGADAQQVCEACGDHQQHPLAPTFQQGIGGHRSAHLDRRNRAIRDGIIRPQPHSLTYALHRRIGVAFGIF